MNIFVRKKTVARTMPTVESERHLNESQSSRTVLRQTKAIKTIKSTSVQIVARRKRGKKPRNKSQQCTLKNHAKVSHILVDIMRSAISSNICENERMEAEIESTICGTKCNQHHSEKFQ
ncbi:hypothetical protein ACOME3_001862 [Neoechinorhynchus agilis]